MRGNIREKALITFAAFFMAMSVALCQGRLFPGRSFSGIYSSLDYGRGIPLYGYRTHKDGWRARIGFTVGINYLRFFNSRWSIVTGLLVSEKSTKFISKYWDSVGPKPISSFYYFKDFFLELPVAIDYNLIKTPKSGIFFGGGISPDIFIGGIYNSKTRYEDGSISEGKSSFLASGELSLIGFVESGIIYKINENLSFKGGFKYERTAFSFDRWLWPHHSLELAASLYHSF